MRQALLLTALLAWGCAPKSVPAQTGAAAWNIPPGCEKDLSGTYVHERRADFRYRAQDRAGTLTLVIDRGLPPDGGTSADDAGTGGVGLEKLPGADAADAGSAHSNGRPDGGALPPGRPDAGAPRGGEHDAIGLHRGPDG